MATETVEMSSVTSNAAANTATVCRPWFANRANAFVALVFALVGIAFAVGLGSGDWYVVEFSTYGGSTVVPAQFSPGSFLVTFSTNVYGLRIGYQCFGPQTAVSYGANAATQGTNGGLQQCVPFTYRSKYLYFNWVSGNSQATSDQTSAANDAVTAYTHLIGASGIIIALLGLGVVIAAHQFLVHIFGAHGVYAPGVIPGRISLVILIILEALVLIFWITIFPYNYFYNQEGNQFGSPSAVASYDTYHTIGLGFSIQIAGLLVGLYGLFSFPKDVVVLKANSV